MMNDGGPAFPVSNEQSHESDEQSHDGVSASEGMSLRDFFAAGAMQGWLASWPMSAPHGCLKNARDVARHSYAIADAMLAEREDS